MLETYGTFIMLASLLKILSSLALDPVFMLAQELPSQPTMCRSKECLCDELYSMYDRINEKTIGRQVNEAKRYVKEVAYVHTNHLHLVAS